jgi:hypothetical protein
MSEVEHHSGDIFERGLTRLLRGDVSMEHLLREHPELDRGLLQAAQEVHRALAPPGPAVSFIASSPVRLRNRIRARASRDTPRRLPRRLPLGAQIPRRFAYALASLLAVFVLIAASAGVAHASSDAIPGSPLYPVKRGVEEVRLALTWSASGDLNLLTDFADERLQELSVAVGQGLTAAALSALDGYEQMVTRVLDRAADLPPQSADETWDNIENLLTTHEEVLVGVLADAPPQAQAGIQNAIERSSHGKEVLEHLREGGSPSDLAPGQLKKTGEPEQGSGKKGNNGSGPKETKTPKPGKEEKSHGPPPWANSNDEGEDQD